MRTTASLGALLLLVLSAGCEKKIDHKLGGSGSLPATPLEAVAPPPAEGTTQGLLPTAFPTLRATSRVIYVQAPDRPHHLTSTFQGTTRARQELRLASGEGEVLVEVRNGEQTWARVPGEESWRVLEGAQALEARRRLELRRATVLFPDGYAWVQGPLVDGLARWHVTLKDTHGTSFGHLEAVVNDEGFSERLTAFDAAGAAQESLRVRTLQSIEDRLWPRDVELEIGGTLLWHEQVLGVQTRVHFLDDFFAPPVPGTGQETQGVFHLDLPAVTERREVLDPARRSWPAAQAEADRAVAEQLERAQRGEPAPDRLVAFELDGDGRPTAILVRLVVASTDAPPEGAQRRPARSAVALLLGDREDLAPQHLARLRAAGGARARDSVPYLREVGAAGRSQVVLPLAPASGVEPEPPQD